MSGSSPSPSSERIDLSEDSAFFLDLLDRTHVWHDRLVSELRFGSRNHIRVASSYQIEFPPALLDRYEGLRQARSANVLLPLTTRPKRQLLNFSLSGPGGSSATLTSRFSIAGLQAQYLTLLARTSTASTELLRGIDSQLYESICLFTPEFFQNTFLDVHDGDKESALTGYLSSGLGWNVLAADVRRWLGRTERVGRLLAECLAEVSDPVSSSEEVLLAVPLNSQLPESAAEIDSLVADYCKGVEAAHRAGDVQFLEALAEYGRRYELVVEVEVPLLEPCRIKVEEDVPLELKLRFPFRTWVEHSFPLRDARSAHLEARVDDPNVEVADYEVRDGAGGDVSGWLEAIRHTREALALYSSEAGRPRFATLWLRLSVTRPLMIAALLLSIANVIAIAAIPLIDFDGSVGDRLAVLVIPTTVAATFALVREQTALASRLQWIPRLVLTATTAILWLEVVAGLIVLDEGQSQSSAERRPGQRSELIGKRVLPLR